MQLHKVKCDLTLAKQGSILFGKKGGGGVWSLSKSITLYLVPRKKGKFKLLTFAVD